MKKLSILLWFILGTYITFFEQPAFKPIGFLSAVIAAYITGSIAGEDAARREFNSKQYKGRIVDEETLKI